MSTSLSEQLQRLAVPHTAALTDSRRKVSILFDSKEAATKDRRTIYEIGVSGLQELTALNSYFQQFETTLFEETTLHLERAVENSDVNELLDENISKFLHHLSPYFLLRPAHMCLEWLLRRFLINQYNRNDLLALALPYHETNAFVLVLQTLRIRPGDSEWDWLRPLRKPGVILPKSAILNRATTDRSFLAFVCRSVVQAVRELGASRAHLLQAHINFYATVVVGALETAAVIEEWHVVTVLPSLLLGLGSQTIDFVSAAFIVAAQFVARTQLTPKLCVSLIERVAGVSFERLRRTTVLLLVWIFDKQTSVEPYFPDRVLLTFVQNKWLTVILARLAKENVAIQSLCCPLLRGSVAAIQSGHEKSDVFKLFLERLISDVEFSTSTAQEVISCFLDSFVAPASSSLSRSGSPALNDGDVIEIDSDDDEMTASVIDFQSWYSEYLRKLERQYPTAFDLTIKDALKSKNEDSSNHSKALKMALGFRLKSLDQNATDLYESLYHHSAEIRKHAIETLLINLVEYQAHPRNYQLLKECLADRIRDDNAYVVAEVLKLKTNDFVKILGYEEFVDALFGILFKTQFEIEHWVALTLPVVQHLTAKEIVTNYDTNIILLALMPLLFPVESSKSASDGIVEILGSALTQKIKVLRELKLNLGKGATSNKIEFSSNDFKKHFLDVISRSKETPAVLDVFASVERYGTKLFQQSMQLAHFILLATAFIKNDLNGAESLKIFKTVCSYCKRFPIKQTSNQQWQKVRKQQFIPLQLFSDFVSTLALHTRFEKQLVDWSLDSKELHCFLSIISFLAEKAFTEETGTSEKLEWGKTLKNVFDIVFKSAQVKIKFLMNFYIYENFELIENYPALRLRSFKLLNAVLNNSQNLFTLYTEHLLKICIALNSTREVIRQEALETLHIVVTDVQSNLDRNLKDFGERILTRRQEISMDHEQLPLAMYTILNPTQKQKSSHLTCSKILKEILKWLSVEEMLRNAVFIAETLQTLKHLNDDQILTALLPLAASALDRTSNGDGGAVKLLEEPYSIIFQRIVERFDNQTIENVLVDQPQAWKLFEKIFSQYDVFVVNAAAATTTGKLQPVTCVALDLLDELAYERMPVQYKIDFIKLIVQTLAIAENDTIFLVANKLLKKCTLDCQPLAVILKRMFHTSNKTVISPHRKSLTSGSKRESGQAQVQIASLAWKEGVALLELLENKKKLCGTEHIIGVLFELLKVCLEVEEQITVEYTKQLILSTLLHCCQKSKAEGIDLQAMLPQLKFPIDQIVQCVRASQNPQTHQNALMLLSHCAVQFPQEVLHNIVVIFTFMGSSVVRHDDAFSFHTINNIIESIIPILVKDNHTSSVSKTSIQKPETDSLNTTLIIPVLKVFSDIMIDVPEHRRLPLYTKLLHTLGAEQYLWMLLCLNFEKYIIDDEKQRLLLKKTSNATGTRSTGSDKDSKRIEMALELTNSFSPKILLGTCIQLMSYVQTLPLNKETNAQTSGNNKPLMGSVRAETSLFDVECRTAQQLRHYKYVIMQFLSSISNSDEFLRKIALLADNELLNLKPYYQNFIIKTLSYVPIVKAAIEKSEDPSKVKYWKVMLHNLHDVLDNAISLLSPDMFLVVVNGLMQHQLFSIRKKVIELLVNKLQQRDSYFDACDEQNFLKMLKPLSDIVDSILEKDDVFYAINPVSLNELVHLQQTALIAIKILSKIFSLKYIEEFKSLLSNLTKITKNRKHISKIVLATVVLTMIEVSSNLKAHSLVQLPKYMPQLIELLHDHAEQVRQQAPDNVCIAIVTGVQKLFEALPLFLGPYMVNIITALSSIATRIAQKQNEKDLRSASVLNKISTIWNKIATEVPMRILVPSCEKAYNKLMNTENYADIEVLMKLLLAAISKTSFADLLVVQSELSNFFMHTLEFRLHLQEVQQRINNFNHKLIATTEDGIINAFVAWVLKLSESSFRPLYHKLYEWALKQKQQQATTMTFFLLTNKIAEALKSLFVLFASDFIDDTAKLLNENNSSIESTITADENFDIFIKVELLKAILGTLHNVFLYDSKGFINTHRFEVLLQPVVDQLENRLVLENVALQQILTSCIAQLAVTVSSDILWKQLNYQVLLKTRTNVPEVRMLSFNCCIEIARKLGEDFTPLLPETVPFIAELFEDENPRVEKNTRKSVQDLEGILGESLQKYL